MKQYLSQWYYYIYMYITGHEVVLLWEQYSTVHSIAQYSTVHYTCSWVQHSTVQYSTVQYSSVQYSIVQYSTVQYSTLQHSTAQYSIVQYSTVQYTTAQHSTAQHSTVQYTCNIPQYTNIVLAIYSIVIEFFFNSQLPNCLWTLVIFSFTYLHAVSSSQYH